MFILQFKFWSDDYFIDDCNKFETIEEAIIEMKRAKYNNHYSNDSLKEIRIKCL